MRYPRLFQMQADSLVSSDSLAISRVGFSRPARNPSKSYPPMPAYLKQPRPHPYSQWGFLFCKIRFMPRDYPIERTRDIGIIAHIDVSIRFSESRILDFALAKSGPEIL